MTKRIVAVLFTMLTVSGCSTYSLEELRHTTPQGNAFQTALAKLYMDFSADEEKDYDWQNSWYFADKGLLAIYGKETPVEDLKDWNLPDELMPQFEKAHDDLIRVLTPQAMARQPEVAAKAQFYFECWLEQQQEGWQQDDIDYCKYGYLNAFAKLDSDGKAVKKPAKKKVRAKVNTEAVKSEPQDMPKEPVKESIKEVVSEPAKEPAKEDGKKAAAPTTTSFVVFFDSGESVLTVTADSVLNDVVKSLDKQENYEVVITDKSKDKKGNGNLSAERIAAVKKRLLGGGIKESAINSGGEGKGMAAQPINRKVEIFLND